MLLRAAFIGALCAALTLPSAFAQQPVWGFADLHAHPASNLGFGADTNGENGLFWGKPAHPPLDLATSILDANLAIDLPPCPTASLGLISLNFVHNNTSDFVKLFTDSIIVSQLDGTAPPGWKHQSRGYPDFAGPGNLPGWPAGLTVDHQVMHISSIKNAFDGGLRLIFASTTDDEVLTNLWNQGFNLTGNSMPTHKATFDYNSASTQLQYITNLVNANSSWMQIVRTPAEARAAINSSPPKLAVVLSLEMDSLSLDDIQKLVNRFGVAHVIPVHLTDNSFGGSAIYNDVFNAESNFINGYPYSAANDQNVNFILGTPVARLEPITIDSVLNLSTGQVAVADIALLGAAAWGPGAVGTIAAAIAAAKFGIQILPTGTFGYIAQTPPSPPRKVPGQINSKDLDQNQFFSLMQMGLLLDIAHMGQKSASTALNMALKYHYPVMDSHTGIRCDSPNPSTGFPAASCSTADFGSPQSVDPTGATNANERGLPTSHLQIIRDLGGVIGLGVVPATLGTDPNTHADPDPVTTWIKNYSIAWELMGKKGVALGTDANGLSPMLQQDTINSADPSGVNTVASRFGCPAGCPPLPPFHLGTRTYNFKNDGIANYGLLPDFIQAASVARGALTEPGPPTAQIAALFHTAEDTIEMWEKVRNAVPTDQASAFDYDGSGKPDHLVLFHAGTGTIRILKNSGGAWTPVYTGGGIGGYDLESNADQITPFDYDGSGKLDHLVLYRPGTGTIWIQKNNAGSFAPVYQGVGIGGYDLLSTADQVFPFDYDGSGKLDHLVLYRPGTGTIWILKNSAGTFTPVYQQGSPGTGIGGYDLKDSADRALAFDYDGSGKMDHLALYRPATGTIWILKNSAGRFTPVYQQGAPGNGIGGYDLKSTADLAFAFDYDGSGKMDHLALYRPGTGTIWILKNSAGTFTPVYQQGAPGNGIGGYGLSSASDRALGFDYDGSGKADHLYLFQSGSGSIIQNRAGSFSTVGSLP